MKIHWNVLKMEKICFTWLHHVTYLESFNLHFWFSNKTNLVFLTRFFKYLKKNVIFFIVNTILFINNIINSLESSRLL